jgi:hypothetical protein
MGRSNQVQKWAIRCFAVPKPLSPVIKDEQPAVQLTPGAAIFLARIRSQCDRTGYEYELRYRSVATFSLEQL